MLRLHSCRNDIVRRHIVKDNGSSPCAFLALFLAVRAQRVMRGDISGGDVGEIRDVRAHGTRRIDLTFFATRILTLQFSRSILSNSPH
jgi:hypothetical protein